MNAALVRFQLRRLGPIVVVACISGAIFNLLTVESSLGAALQGAVDGLLISVVVGCYIVFLYEGVLRARLRAWSFLANLAFNGSVLLVLFLAMRGLGQVLTTGNPARFYLSLLDPHLLWSVPFFAAFVFALQFLLQMNRMVGTNVLGYFVAGVYRRPVAEERIFMFLDLESSTRLTQQLGGLAYYELLRRFVNDLSGPILETQGEIYQYAGDEVVITWRRDAGLRRANCVRCFFLILEAIEANAALYRREFGVVPRFRAGLHGGRVLAGELGDLRQGIVFVGDPLNTAARLEEHARVHKERFVVSGEILEQLELPEGVRAEPLGEFRPRGQAHSLATFGLTATATEAA